MPDILTIKQVAQHLQANERAIYRLAASHGIRGFKLGGSWRLRKTDIEGWITDQSNRRGDQS